MDKTDVTQCKVVVLAGGWSDEREISMDSGRACAKALGEAGFKQVDLLDVADADFLAKLVAGNYDVAFVAMHGRWGEDGCVQGLLEVMHLPYTFSGVLTSAVATEKDFAKSIFRSNGIPTARGTKLAAGHIPDEVEVETLVDKFGLPLFVKPAANGSSYGISMVHEASQLAEAVRLAGEGGQRVIVEECVTGTEITVPVIGNDDPQALPIVEVVAGEGAEFYDLKVKYEPSELHHVMPARLPQDVYERAQRLAVRAHKALGCRGASRSDFIVKADGQPVILETNTIPGMTETSLLPDSARHAGIEFPELCRRFVEWALE
jgi:D-alanine-D-alanine ligase